MWVLLKMREKVVGCGKESKCQVRRGDHMSEVIKFLVDVLALEQLLLSSPKRGLMQA